MSVIHSEVMCSWCGRLPTTDESDPEGLLIQNEPARNVAICGYCLSDAVLAIYEAGGVLPRITERLRDEFAVSHEFEENMKDEIRAQLRERYQRELINARDPQPFIGEQKSVFVGVTMSRYARERVGVLAREAGLSISGWVRRAIFLAFDVTKHSA